MVLGETGLIKGVAATSVRQREFHRTPDVDVLDKVGSSPCGVRPGRTGDHEITAQTVHLELHADRRDAPKLGRRQPYRSEHRACPRDGRGDLGVLVGELCRETCRVVFIRKSAFHHLDARRDLLGCGDIHRQTESIQQLRAELTLFWVHRPHEDKTGRLRVRDAVTLDDHPARRRCVQQHVDEVVGEQVDLVDVEHSPIGVRQQPWRESLFTLGQNFLQVE